MTRTTEKTENNKTDSVLITEKYVLSMNTGRSTGTCNLGPQRSPE